MSFAIAATSVALAVGMIGYHYLESLNWIDSFLNASMILGGMGEVDTLKTECGKIFAGLYALFSGLWIVTSMGIILAPVFHRIIHSFHQEQKRD
ncbi:MAG: hypothetical protein PW788_09045 [Micavibrio sp.]|nr:hypothetical protein [Micavibrio sp.]